MTKCSCLIMKKQFKQPTLPRHLNGTCTFEVLFFFKIMSCILFSVVPLTLQMAKRLNFIARSTSLLVHNFPQCFIQKDSVTVPEVYILSEFVILDILLEKICQQTLHFVTSLTNKLRRGEKKLHSDAENPAIMQIQIVIMWQVLA